MHSCLQYMGVCFNPDFTLECISSSIPALLVRNAEMKAVRKKEKARSRYRRRSSPKTFRELENRHRLFVASKCYFTDALLGCLHRQIELDVEMYWYGLKRRNHAILTHARRHFVQHAYRYWSRVASQVVLMLFHDPRFALIGELKEFAVRVARDHLCLSGKRERLKRTIFHPSYLWKGREFRSMLQEELRHSWMIGKIWTHPPPNTWYSYEERYRKDLADMNSCKSRC